MKRETFLHNTLSNFRVKICTKLIFFQFSSPPLPPRRRSKSGVTSASRYRPKVGSTSRRRPVLVDLPPPVHNPKRRSRRASGMEDGPASSGLLGAIMEMEQASAVGGAEHMGRERRSLRNHPTASKRSICIHVCLQ